MRLASYDAPRAGMWARPVAKACRRMLLVAVSAALAGCAGQIVRPSQLPPRPAPEALDAVVLSLRDVPAPMQEEFRAFAADAGAVRELAAAPAMLAAACESPAETVLRPRLGRAHFASNAGDRNTLFIYETAVVVGIPVTLISAAAWPWYGEMMKEGALEWVSCRDRTLRDLSTSVHLRSEGHGFVRGGTIEKAQEDAALRALARKLLSDWTRTMSQSEGGRP